MNKPDPDRTAAWVASQSIQPLDELTPDSGDPTEGLKSSSLGAGE
jgi:hypothetical protein